MPALDQPTTKGPQGGNRRGSEHFEDAIDWTISQSMADADRNHAIQPVVARVRRLEQWVESEIIAVRIHHFSSLDSRHDIGRPITNGTIGHADEGFILG